MKFIRFSRQRILRAVRAACVAIFFAACTARAQAQSHSPEYTVNGSTVTGVGPSNSSSAYFSDTSAQGYQVTINPGITLGTTSMTEELQFNHGTVINNGTISGGTQKTIFLSGTGNVTNSSGSSIVNSVGGSGLEIDGVGTVTNSGYIGSLDGGAVLVGGGGNITNTATGLIKGENGIALYYHGAVTNSGVIDGTLTTAISFNSLGTFSVANTSTGSITSVDGIFLDGGGTVSNSGYMKATNGDGIQINGTGSVTNSASGYIGASGVAIYLPGGGTTFNAGTISASYGITVKGSTASTIQNTGIIHGSGSSSGYVGIYGDGTGAVSVFNSGTISAQYGIYLRGNNSSLLDAGGTITSSSVTIGLNGTNQSATLQGRPVVNGTMSGYSGTGNTLNFQLAGLTPAQAAALKSTITTAGSGAGSVTFTGTNFFAGKTYSFQDFPSVNDQSVSLEQVVDPGLHDVAVKLDNAGTLPSSYDALFAAAATNPEGALNQFSGREFYQAFGSMNLSNTLAFGELADSRAFQLRAGTGGLDLSQLSVVPSSMIASLGQTDDALGKMLGEPAFAGTRMIDVKDEKMTATPREPGRWGAWVSGTVTQADESSVGAAPGYRATTGTPALGFDLKIHADLAVGALASYSSTGANFADGSRLGEETYLLGLYGVYSHDHFFANGLVGAGYSAYDNKRVAPGGAGNAMSHPQGGEILANLDAGYDFKVANWNFDPEIGADYTHLAENSFNESGAGALDLSVADQNVDSLRSKVGFRALGDYRWDGIRFSPEIHADYYHEFMDNSRGVQLGTPGAPAIGSFVVQTGGPERDFALLGVGIAATPDELNELLTFFFNYNVQVGQSDFMANTFEGGVRLGF
jgi:uncharacterized protein with beta-barrel porin domain